MQHPIALLSRLTFNISPLPDLTFRLLSFFSQRELAIYSGVSKTSHQEMLNFSRLAFDLTQVLSQFFLDQEIIQFRVIQALTRMVISGSTALQFLQRESYPNSDLDIYVEHCFAHIVGHFLMSLHYTFDPQNNSRNNFDTAITAIHLRSEADPVHQYSLSHIARVYNFVKGANQRIQLITAVFSPLDIILNFHSTVVMNVISYSHAYSIYPHATFEDRTSLICSCKEGPELDQALQKYINRGWTIINADGDLKGHYPADHTPTHADPGDRLASFQVGKERRLGDRHTWVLPLAPIPTPQNLAQEHPWTSSKGFPIFPSLVTEECSLKFQLVEANCWILNLLLDQQNNLDAFPMQPEPVAAMVYETWHRPALRYTYCVLERIIE
ncbi:hypothetical protein GYMLUDRAFT_174917 [Collybiopsis luxurians FD-317 M1]|uniref:Uncharacterized protein n=1 Tax=Collybiopsis luxurians FD-317 M1 TaxID=944289 RepID=A0A0D0CLM0_9AGAR|nr:hypothetical protein GYMLUDRAFT_174917 [Collybiopsis luxurians FD-317 M1]